MQLYIQPESNAPNSLIEDAGITSNMKIHAEEKINIFREKLNELLWVHDAVSIFLPLRSCLSVTSTVAYVDVSNKFCWLESVAVST